MMHSIRRLVLRTATSRPSTLLQRKPQVAFATSRLSPIQCSKPRPFTTGRSLHDDLASYGHNFGNLGRQAEQSPPDASTPPLRFPPVDTLYVGNLSFETSENDLKELFEEFGEVLATTLVRNNQGLSKGFAFVKFKSVDIAGEAMKAMNATTVKGRRISVHYQAPRRIIHNRSSPPSSTLYIGNVSYQMTDSDLQAVFNNVEGCINIRVAVDRNNDTPRGYVHVDFVDTKAAGKAKEYLSLQSWYGRRFIVDYAEPRNNLARRGAAQQNVYGEQPALQHIPQRTARWQESAEGASEATGESAEGASEATGESAQTMFEEAPSEDKPSEKKVEDTAATTT